MVFFLVQFIGWSVIIISVYRQVISSRFLETLYYIKNLQNKWFSLILYLRSLKLCQQSKLCPCPTLYNLTKCLLDFNHCGYVTLNPKLLYMTYCRLKVRTLWHCCVVQYCKFYKKVLYYCFEVVLRLAHNILVNPYSLTLVTT